MFLSDPVYFVFLGLTFLLYYTMHLGAPRRFLLLAASYFFYFELVAGYALVLLLVTGITYFGARRLRSASAEGRGGWIFFLLLSLALIPLLFFKYAMPLLAKAGYHGLESIAFPIGISFFTFAALGYLIDVYLEVVEPETDFVRVALFLSFFPLVSSGPIERAGRLLPQLECTDRFSAENAFSALRLILVGLILKLEFAGYLRGYADAVFTLPGNYPPISRLLGVIFYAFTLYSDFLGYSLIAIGSARLLGLNVRPNFQQPFLSGSVPEFWRNWHISLSSWIRDYLFTPLRMEWRRFGNIGMGGALIFSFLIIGVWHGARWGYVVFGLMHGVFVTTSALVRPRCDAFWKSMRVPLVWLHVPRVLGTFGLVLIAYVAFRAPSLTNALTLYRGIFSIEIFRNMGQSLGYSFFHQGRALDYRLVGLTGCWERVALLVAGDTLVRNKISLETLPKLLQGALCILGVIVIAYQWIEQDVAAPFQYYKF